MMSSVKNSLTASYSMLDFVIVALKAKIGLDLIGSSANCLHDT